MSPSEKRTHINNLVDEFLARDPLPDGLFVPDDQITAMVCGVLQRRGIHPGQDVVVVSCGNEGLSLNTMDPPPATIDLAPEVTGQLQTELLLQTIRGIRTNLDRVHLAIEPELVIPEND